MFFFCVERVVNQLEYGGMVDRAAVNRSLISDTWATRMGVMTVPFRLLVSLEYLGKKLDQMKWLYLCSMNTLQDGSRS